MALDQPKQLVSCFLLLLTMVSLSQAKAQQCKSPDSDQDRRTNYTMDNAFEFHLIDKASGRVISFARNSFSNSNVSNTVDLSFLRDLFVSDSYVNNTVALSTFGLWRPLSRVRYELLGSFSVTIVYQPLPDQSLSGLAFLIIPFSDRTDLVYGANSSLAKQLVASDVGSLHLLKPTSGSAPVSGSSVSASARIGALANLTARRYDSSVMVVDINIDQVAAAMSSYSVWIDYDRVGRSLSVYVDFAGKPKPNKTIVETQNISNLDSPFFYFGLLSTTQQRLRAGDITWSATVDDLPPPVYYPNKGGFLTKKVTILFSVFGSVAAAAAMAAAVACYLNSMYRQWHKDLVQLAKSMERLPGVPTKVDFADINKATRNFHDDMKLGGGGFGTVYRCTLPPAASKMERQMDVAIKRFTRDVQNRRYDDFLAEVSIINRLRHKNIVPLIGWSYNKGVPLLVFEFMRNGSLDQHLFHRGGGGTRQRNTDGAIRQWATRYEIIRGVATGLHYVHHEYEPMVLHRDIKASNIMLDSSFQARLGDFGLACTVSVDRNSVTGMGGTWGYIAPEYPVSRKATRQTDIYALGVLILEVVTGLRALADHEVVDDDDMHITDRVWRLYREGRLLECVDAMLTDGSTPDDEEQLDTTDDVERLLLLGLACSNPNPSDRPTMPDVVRVIAKSAPPPQVPPQKPRFVWPPQEEGRSVTSDGGGSTVLLVGACRSVTFVAGRTIP
ncbi:L-type lectin-domain containing receptor kinase IX.2-like [Triticum dicoccoides]|uniref:L-type lectin-domain containing receptor kinase IX.2-like n=1 Tax=Triticum dicoccoides TaxID=85692 RepID=UPI00189108F6|nr:L-type lectin-domain containing receptor kinase IX.2-like [Triticum dicoccoides]